MKLFFAVITFSLITYLSSSPSESFKKLGLDSSASQKEIRKAYHLLAKDW